MATLTYFLSFFIQNDGLSKWAIWKIGTLPTNSPLSACLVSLAVISPQKQILLVIVTTYLPTTRDKAWTSSRWGRILYPEWKIHQIKGSAKIDMLVAMHMCKQKEMELISHEHWKRIVCLFVCYWLCHCW